MSNLTEKWKQTGLLEEFEGNTQNLAESLEKGYQYICENEVSETLAGIVLPAISRIYRESNVKKVDGEKVATALCEDEEKHKQMIENIESYYAVDAEAEFTETFVESYIQKEL